MDAENVLLEHGSHVIAFVDEEELPLTAEDVQYSETQTVKDAIDGLKSSVSDGKALVASAITDKGVDTAQDATFGQMAENIGKISTGSDTSDATATSFDILAPKTAYTAVGKVEGALESSFQATLTVTADTGAVVTATHTDGTKVEVLSTTGTVVLELPKEGAWKVTAVRGVAQYNTVTIQVSSQYSAELTAEVHVEYYEVGSPLATARYDLAAASIGNYALFGGGRQVAYSTSAYVSYATDNVDIYDKNLAKQIVKLSEKRYGLAAAAVGDYAIFAGGADYTYTPSSGKNEEFVIDTVDAFSKTLTRLSAPALSLARHSLAAASIGDCALFGGGRQIPSAITSKVDAYLVRTTPKTGLKDIKRGLAAASVENYALFAGGRAVSESDIYKSVDIYQYV